MYAQVEKPKENKSRAVANSVGQRKGAGKQGFGFVDNRSEAVVQKKLQKIVSSSTEVKATIQSQSMSTNKDSVIQRDTTDAILHGATGAVIGARAGVVGAVVGGALGAAYGYREEISEGVRGAVGAVQEYFNGVWIQNGNNYTWLQGQPDHNLYVNTGRTRRDNFMVLHDVYESWGNVTQNWLNNVGIAAFANDPNQGYRAQQGQRFVFRWFNALTIGNNNYSVGVNLHASGNLGSMWISGVDNFDINPVHNPITAQLQTRLRTLVTQGWGGNEPLQNPNLYASPTLKINYPWIYPKVVL